jgi:XTP/dITP diphosphohydrolase
MKLVMATTNQHKIEEVRAILANTGIVLSPLSDHPSIPEPPETGDTFVANALQKAHFVHQRLGVPVIADDSGLEVDALDGAPGVHSKRFSEAQTHEANNALLLEKLKSVTARGARFKCVLALVTDTSTGTVEGTCEGQIAHGKRGEQGFGYDPIFMPDELPGRSMAEASLDDKNAISHRGRAFRQLTDLLTEHGVI